MVLKDKGGLKRHTESQHLRKRHKCTYPDCDADFSTEHDLKLHVDDVHKKIRFKCPDCGETFNRKRMADRHLNQRHKGVYILCPFQDCTEVFKVSNQLMIHAQIEHSGEGFPCRVDGCEETFPSPAEVREHMRIGHQAKNTPCPKAKEYGCTMLFLDETEAEKHVADEHAGRSPKCETCGKTFASFKIRREHERVRTHPFECPQVFCKLRFKTAIEALDHSTAPGDEHHLRESLYTCPIPKCYMAITGVSTTKNAIDVHWQVHIDDGHVPPGSEVPYISATPRPLKRVALFDEIYERRHALYHHDRNNGEDTTELEGDHGELDVDDPEINGDEIESDAANVEFDTRPIPKDNGDLSSEERCAQIMADNRQFYWNHSDMRIDLYARGRTCLGPSLKSKFRMDEPCPKMTRLDVDSARIVLSHTRLEPLMVSSLQCVFCEDEKTEREICRRYNKILIKDASEDTETLSTVQAKINKVPVSSDIPEVDVPLLRDLFNTEAEQRWGPVRDIGWLKKRGKDYYKKAQKRDADYARVQERVQEIKRGGEGSGLIVLDDEWTAGNSLGEFSAIEYVSGDVLINTRVKRDRPELDWNDLVSTHPFAKRMEWIRLNQIYAPGRHIETLDVHSIYLKLKQTGINPKTLVLVWHLHDMDLRLLRQFLASAGRGHEKILPLSENCIPLIQFFRYNLPKKFCLKLEIVFRVLFPKHNLVGRNHQALVDCLQTRLVMLAFDWLCQPVEERGKVWSPMNVEGTAQTTDPLQTMGQQDGQALTGASPAVDAKRKNRWVVRRRPKRVKTLDNAAESDD
ncbi:hypothetical protein NW768_000019 [Fusarium equiseti]|uniref:C2H2-type domain-containing protein n=1 Tax=Fusarium equiseti TaxID=61235 RepID=A0ABQ8RRD1_FUSEQ|nr:hypothetical protein NW768_000019 [Fusarium equiseti]